MKNRIIRSILLNGFAGIVLLSWATSASAVEDWPHWRGPNHNDKSSETGLLKSWPENGPKRVWINKDSGIGYGGFSIVDGKLFTVGTEEDKGEFALCLNADTGEEIWRTPIADIGMNRGRATRRWGDGSRSTPTVDGDRVYTLSASGVLACLKAADGSLVWSKKMSDFGGSVPAWGYSESPLVDGKIVVCTPGGNKGAVLALDKMTGQTVWQSADATAAAHYSSVLPMEIAGNKQYVQLLVDKVVGLDPASGGLLWSVPWNGRTAVIPSPVKAGDQVYVTSAYNAGSMMVDPGANSADKIWDNIGMQNHHGGVLFLDGYIYGHTNRQRGAFACQNAKDGEIVYRNSDIKKGSLTYAEGLVYYIEKDSGKVMLLDVSPEEAKVVSSFVLPDQSSKRRNHQGKIWVHPVIANGKLYLRDQERISCFDIKQK